MMKRVLLFVAVSVFAYLALVAIAHSGTDTAAIQNKSSDKQAILNIAHEDDRITAAIVGASLQEVIQVLGDVTGLEFVLLGDQRWAKQAVYAQVNKAPLEEALSRILRGYSYAVSTAAGSKMPTVTIVLKRVNVQSPPESVLSDTDEVAVKRDESAGVKAKNENDSLKAAYVPYDLEEYMPLPDEGLDELGSDQDSEQGPATGPDSAEQRALKEEGRRQARLERSLDALNSEHPHLRPMAVEELVGINDPRAATALETVASTEGASSSERRQATQALWHHAADLKFADPIANEALRRLASDGDPSVQDIAKRALVDMERYQRRLQN